MTRSFLIILLLLLGLSGYSQERTLLKGKILTHDRETSSINIINLTSETGTTNNSEGEFEMEVRIRDTLFFSSVQYEPREIFITKEVLKNAFLTVLLVEKIDELEEVTLSDISLSGNLATDINNIPTLTQADLGFPMSDRLRPTSIERKLKAASNLSTSSPRTPAGPKVSLDGILNQINGRTEMLQKAAANEDLKQAVDSGLAALPSSFFTDLAIPEDRIRDFVYFCAEDPEYYFLLSETKRLDLVAFFQVKASEFLKARM